MMYGYQHRGYAESLSEFGVQQQLQRSDGWILVREIDNSAYRDAIGCYPIFCCRNWDLLQQDIIDLGADLVSLTIVTDPFGDFKQETIKQCFPDLMIPFKQHYVAELSLELDAFVHAHHHRNAQKALQKISIEHTKNPTDALLADWVRMYDHLIVRHRICGIAAFSDRAFAMQFRVPGLTIFRAEYQGKCVGMVLWYVQGPIAYYHLGAYSTEGYQLKASFALFWRALEYFRSAGIQWISLGAGAGLQQKEDGLTRFKSGWSTGTRQTYLCGRIFNPKAYQELLARQGTQKVAFFPAYRAIDKN